MGTSTDESDQLLRQIAADLAEIKEVLVSFTGDGLPLRAQIPNNELLASLLMAGAMISRNPGAITAEDLAGRIAAAQVIASDAIRHFDHYQSQTQVAHLQQRLQS
jgi:hypothetical protein